MTPLARLYWVSLVIKLVLVAMLPLTSDEAYYWVWSQHPQLSYFDHPPVVAWLFTLGDWLRFIPGGARWPGVLLAHAGLALWLRVLTPYLSGAQLWWWLVLALTSPLLGGSALVITPDVPLLFFYGLATMTYLRWRERPTALLALALGLTIGLGFTSKYMMVLFPLSLIVPTLRARDTRRAFVRGLPLLTLGFVAGTMPVWLWNLFNDFASLRFQTHHGLGHKVWKSSWTSEYVGLQLALIAPPLAWWAWRQRKTSPLDVLPWLAVTPLVFFLFTTSRGYAEANWPIAAYPAVFALAVSAFPRNRLAIRGTAVVWSILLATLAGVILLQPPWTKATKLREFHQYDEVVARVGEAAPLFARSYQMASKLSFELGRPVYKLRGMLRHDFFDELPQSVPERGTYYVILERDDRLPDEFLARGDQVVESHELGDFEIRKVETK